MTGQIKYSGVHHNWNAPESLPTSLTVNVDDEPLGVMTIGTELLTRRNNQNYQSVSRNLPNAVAIPILGFEYQRWHLRIQNKRLSFACLETCGILGQHIPGYII